LTIRYPIVTIQVRNSTSFVNYPQVIIAENDQGFISGIQYFAQKISDSIEIQKTVPEHCTWSYKTSKISDDIITFKKLGFNSHMQHSW
jgi:hypothetical protein